MTAVLARPVAPDLSGMELDTDPGPHNQIIPMTEALRAYPGDAYPGEDIWDVMFRKSNDYGYQGLKDSIERWGLGAGFGVEIEEGYIYNGHHRLTVLVELGAEWCPIQGPEFYQTYCWHAPDGSTPGSYAH